jgi:hypothetical protein
LEAAPYKESDPSFYAMFTKGNVFSEKPDSKFIEMAKQAASKKGSMKNEKGQIVQLRQGPYRTITQKDREELRRKALHAKITQNADVMRILENTRDATLKQFQRGRRLYNDTLLSDIRTTLIKGL